MKTLSIGPMGIKWHHRGYYHYVYNIIHVGQSGFTASQKFLAQKLIMQVSPATHNHQTTTFM